MAKILSFSVEAFGYFSDRFFKMIQGLYFTTKGTVA